MESWEYSYEYVVKDGKVYVAPMSLRCMGCDFVSWGGKAMLTHQMNTGHFYKMIPDEDKIEEWKPSKHPMIPLIMQMHMPQLMKSLVTRDVQ